LTWRELESAYFKQESALFSITEAGNWCSETLGFYSEFDVVEGTETWNFVELLSANSNFQYSYICEDPVFTIDFNGESREWNLSHHADEVYNSVF